ncbi:MAG TPA: hydrogenase expression/formation protein HypE [bacterium]|nr:hydrogenase expression/formation protein HypE [bacterium]HPN43443.1 hydrogenase expression/formation protein HypE [bacterium]
MQSENPAAACGACPIPIEDYPHIVMAHGGGGELSRQLLDKMFKPTFANPLLANEHDGAVIPRPGGKLAFTTDSYVIQPLFFPGGDIGKLAVYGTVNDLAMCGAKPQYISLAFILQEGLPMQTLWNVVNSIRVAAQETGVQIVTGDTKVVEKCGESGLFINTSGIGIIEHNLTIGPAAVQTGDVIILSGDIGRHGMAVMALREGLEFESQISSDCAPLHDIVKHILAAGINVHCMRDLTRGGLASALVEISSSARKQIDIAEDAIPVREDVRAACELLGLDPLYVANEGRFILFVPQSETVKCLEICHAHPQGHDALVIGRVSDTTQAVVIAGNAIGGQRVIRMFSGEQLPRIC